MTGGEEENSEGALKDFESTSGVANRCLHFAIYLALPNKHRGPIAAALARTLLRGGHQVTFIGEELTTLRLGTQPRILRSNNKEHINQLRKIPGLKVHSLNTYAGRTQEGLEQSDVRREELLSELLPIVNPDYIFVWNGRFNYQAGMRRAVEGLGLQDRVLYMEVAWFSQREYIYFDSRGINSGASFAGQPFPGLRSHQSVWLDAWLSRYRIARLGAGSVATRMRHVFVPLQVDTDTSIMNDSPFDSMRKFISFLEEWLPPEYSATIKLHPKATYTYVPASRRENFSVLCEGGIDDYLHEADTVVGINSTVLLEAAAMGKRVISFGRGLFSGTRAMWEARPDDPASDYLEAPIEPGGARSLLYHLVARRQVSLSALEAEDYEHLATRTPFAELLKDVVLTPSLVSTLVAEGRIMLRIGNSKVSKTAQLDVERCGTIIVGDDSEIRHHAVLEISGRYNGTIEIGDRSVVGIGCWLQGSGKIEIGSDVLIGPYTSVVSTNHSYEDVSVPVAQQPLVTGTVTIEDDVWIGARCTILSDVRIGAHSIVGANSLVTQDIPPYSIAVGTPAKVIKTRR
jgi:acetyltransferase-like isoleucine patch superfamily enzyme